jgi:hypothetical protein
VVSDDIPLLAAVVPPLHRAATVRREARVRCVDGPAINREFCYSYPLPQVLVVAVRTEDGPRWHDYRRTRQIGSPARYMHAGSCKCRDEPPIVQL